MTDMLIIGRHAIYSQEDMESSFKTNFHGPLNITRAILPKLRAKGSGSLLYIGSQAGWHADPSAAAYCAAKFALEGASVQDSDFLWWLMNANTHMAPCQQGLLSVSLKN